MVAGGAVVECKRPAVVFQRWIGGSSYEKAVLLSEIVKALAIFVDWYPVPSLPAFTRQFSQVEVVHFGFEYPHWRSKYTQVLL